MTTQTEAASIDPWRPEDTLGARLLLVRHQLRLSQREASMRTGVSYGVWQGMEIGRETRGVDKAVAKIASALAVDRDWLMWGGSVGGGSGTAMSGWSADSRADDELVAA